MHVAIIGAGVGGMAAAHDLVNAGHQVTIFEASNNPGGLAAGFKEPEWDWSVEQFYHHWFTSDKDMFQLLEELGLRERVEIHRPKTVAYFNGQFYPLDSPLSALVFPGFKFIDMVRFGLVTAYLRYIAAWQPLEKSTADVWMRKVYGPRLYSILVEPLLQGKFGRHYQDVNMAWFWARFKVRTTRLATFQGGFQSFADQFAANLQQRGVKFSFNTPIQRLENTPEGKVRVTLPDGTDSIFDRALVTVSPGLLARIAPDLPKDYLHGLLNLQSMGAAVMVLSLNRPLSEQGYYWYNIPKSAGFPFLALVEHTNFVSREHFNNDTIIYCGDYLDAGHEYFTLSKEELLERFLPSFQRINPRFNRDWIKQVWLFRTNYAQPIPLVNHSRNIPAIKTPLTGLYFASMSQVYPWDRGTNFAVQIARKAARQMLAEM